MDLLDLLDFLAFLVQKVKADILVLQDYKAKKDLQACLDSQDWKGSPVHRALLGLADLLVLQDPHTVMVS